MDIKDLIGKRFRRNKYGLSLWEDEIVDIEVQLHLVNEVSKSLPDYFGRLKESGILHGWYPEIMIKGKKGHYYNFKEIIVYGQNHTRQYLSTSSGETI